MFRWGIWLEVKGVFDFFKIFRFFCSQAILCEFCVIFGTYVLSFGSLLDLDFFLELVKI